VNVPVSAVSKSAMPMLSLKLVMYVASGAATLPLAAG
jgi:hypothetical protein